MGRLQACRLFGACHLVAGMLTCSPCTLQAAESCPSLSALPLLLTCHPAFPTRCFQLAPPTAVGGLPLDATLEEVSTRFAKLPVPGLTVRRVEPILDSATGGA
jgi:hypothetical protein